MSREKKQVVEDSAPGAPAYIVTFSDMVTLLLTFFVMLLSLANTQDPELIDRGRDAILRSIKGLGIGLGQGKKFSTQLAHKQTYHRTDMEDSTSPERLIDAEEEKIRRLFRAVSQSMKAIPSQITSSDVSYNPTRIKFAVNGFVLNETDKDFLNDLCLKLSDNYRAEFKICVIGVANDIEDEKQKWILSARRAKVVADFIEENFSNRKLNYPVYSWGTCDGGDWTGRDSPFSKELQVLIIILRTNYWS